METAVSPIPREIGCGFLLLIGWTRWLGDIIVETAVCAKWWVGGLVVGETAVVSLAKRETGSFTRVGDLVPKARSRQLQKEKSYGHSL